VRRAALVLGLVAAALALYFFLGDLDEPRRFALALATIGFFWAPESEKPLRVGLWLLGVASVAWVAQVVGRGTGGLALWTATSVAAVLLVVRGGSRASLHYLPIAGSESGVSERRAVRLQLRVAILLFVAAYLFGSTSPGAFAFVVAASAAFFLRYILLQSKFLGIPAAALAKRSGIVWAQRWMVLALFAALSRFEKEVPGPLFVTAALLALLAALVFVLALVRAGFDRSFVRRASFAAGIGLAVTVTAVLVELESWGPSRYRVFASAGIFFLVALPLVRDQTKLFHERSGVAALVPESTLSAMMVPLTALNGTRWALPTTVFLFAFGALVLVYHAVVAIRDGATGRLYLSLSLLVTVYLFLSASGGGAWQVFCLSVGLSLYSVDFFERVWRSRRARERISES
jgi:hypothetical protein